MNKSEELQKILEPLHVSYKSNNKEVIIKCPYCGDKTDEHHVSTGHFHMYINVETGQFHCFLCGASGPLKKLIIDQQHLLNITADQMQFLAVNYIFTSDVKPTILPTNIKFHQEIKEQLELLPSNDMLIKHIYDRLVLDDGNNDKLLNYIIKEHVIIYPMPLGKNQMINNISPKYPYYIIPMFLYGGIQYYSPNSKPKYLIVKIDDNIPGVILLGNMYTPTIVYLVEGIWDGIKLYNILNMDNHSLIIVLTGKSKVNLIIQVLKILNLDYHKLTYIFGLDSDVPREEYLYLLNKFRNTIYNDYIDNNIFLYVWKNLKYKDIGEVPSIAEFYNNTQLVDFLAYQLKPVYDKLFIKKGG
ncbi:MAG: hypothetical protein QXV17_01475 [Candidatus Micrarchaeaceae archaeon]